MKKKALLPVLFVTALLASGCRKESGVISEKSEPMIITALAEGIGMTRTTMAYKYDVLWSEGDEITVKGADGSDTFTLVEGAGTTTGIFRQTGSTPFEGETEAFYPTDICTSSSYMWPARQTRNLALPMYCRKTLSGDSPQEFKFSSLGAVLQIVLSTTDSGIRLSRIRIRDASKPISGAFTVTDGKAVMIAADTAGITLELDDIEIGNAAKYFNIAVPAGKYDNLKLTFFTNDGRASALHSTTMPEIEHNTVAKISLCAKNFNPFPTGIALDVDSIGIAPGGHYRIKPVFFPSDTYNKTVIWSSSNSAVAAVNPDGTVTGIAVGDAVITAQLEDEVFCATCKVTVREMPGNPNLLDGLFSVSDSKTVRFAKSNLCKTGGAFTFQDNQFTIASGDATEGISWDEWHNWLGGEGSSWQVLSSDEWTYLFGDNGYRKGLYATNVTVAGTADCVVLYPDGYEGIKVSESDKTTLYDDLSVWTAAQQAGVVCLTPVKTENRYEYWTSTVENTSRGVFTLYDSNLVPELRVWWTNVGDWGHALRPVAEYKP